MPKITKHAAKILSILIFFQVSASFCFGNDLWDLRKTAADVQASSEEPGNEALKACDGDFGTRWSSEFKDDQWINIDLGSVREITLITLVWESACASVYRLEASNDRNDWKILKEINDGKPGKIDFDFSSLKARYIRMSGVKRATGWGFSLYEFLITGPHQGNEPEYGGLVRPSTHSTIFDRDWKELSVKFADQLSRDPPDSKKMSDDEFLDLVERRAFDYYWYEVDPESFFVADSTTWKTHTSIAAIGLELGALIIGHSRKYRDQDEIYRRVEKLLDNCYDDPNDPKDLCLENHSGWPYHWVNIRTGVWEGQENVCTHDCLMYFCGVIAAKHYFKNTKAGDIAAKIVDSIDWKWIIHGGMNKRFVSNCYAKTFDPPCGGEVRWYDGMKFDYILPIGGEKSSVSPEYWQNYAQDFPWEAYNGHFWRIERPALWIHQWDNIWFDFRYMKDDYADYFQNSVEATLANRQWSVDQGWYNGDLWGLNPCLGPDDKGGGYYKDYGAPPDKLPFQKGTDNDFTINTAGGIPCILFTPGDSIKLCRNIYDNYKDKVWHRYGFTDSLNPKKNWFSRDYIGIDIGPTMLAIENYRSGLIWKAFSGESTVWNGLQKCGFVTVIDDFDGSEHSPPYAEWGSSDVKAILLERSTETVRQAEHSLQVRIENSGPGHSFFAKANRTIAPYEKFLSLWVNNGPDLEVRIISGDNQGFPLKKERTVRTSGGWNRIYYSLPEGISRISEIDFIPVSKSAGKFFIDDVIMTGTVNENEPDTVIEDFDNGFRNEWVSDMDTRIQISDKESHGGKKSLQFNKSAVPSSCELYFKTPQDLRKYHSVSLFVKGKTDVTLGLQDKSGRFFNCDRKVISSGDWDHVFFNIQANLNPANFWDIRYDKSTIMKIKLAVSKRAEEIYLDDITLTE